MEPINAWDMYFCSIVSMNQHPGNNRENAEKLTVKQCALIADLMIEHRNERSIQWRGSEPQ